jgi:hypothetical protein
VAYRNSAFLERNLKHHPDSELGALEVEFRPLPIGKPNYSRVWLDAKFDSTQFQKEFCPISSSDRKVMVVLLNHLRVRVSKVRC